MPPVLLGPLRRIRLNLPAPFDHTVVSLVIKSLMGVPGTNHFYGRGGWRPDYAINDIFVVSVDPTEPSAHIEPGLIACREPSIHNFTATTGPVLIYFSIIDQINASRVSQQPIVRTFETLPAHVQTCLNLRNRDLISMRSRPMTQPEWDFVKWGVMAFAMSDPPNLTSHHRFKSVFCFHIDQLNSQVVDRYGLL